MKDYIRRSAKFILYLVIIFVVVLFIFPLISDGIAPRITFDELIHNQKSSTVFRLPDRLCTGLSFDCFCKSQTPSERYFRRQPQVFLKKRLKPFNT